MYVQDWQGCSQLGSCLGVSALEGCWSAMGHMTNWKRLYLPDPLGGILCGTGRNGLMNHRGLVCTPRGTRQAHSQVGDQLSLFPRD